MGANRPIAAVREGDVVTPAPASTAAWALPAATIERLLAQPNRVDPAQFPSLTGLTRAIAHTVFRWV